MPERKKELTEQEIEKVSSGAVLRKSVKTAKQANGEKDDTISVNTAKDSEMKEGKSFGWWPPL